MPRVAEDLLDYLTDAETVLPAPQDIEVMVGRILDLHRQNGGATFNLYFGDMAGQPLFAVSVFPVVTAVEPARFLSPNVLRQYVRDVERLLRDPRNNVGTWYNPSDASTYLDISTTLPEREVAITLADQFNQIAIYDLAQREELPTFGTGEDTSDLPPEDERLPPFSMVRGSL